VLKIYQALYETEQEVEHRYPAKQAILPKDIYFISSEELLAKYPDLTPKERENAIAKEYGAVFIYCIGGELSNGFPHDGRASDYDDCSTENENGYKGLNGDMLIWNPILHTAFELSSMGIRVDKKALLHQLELRHSMERTKLSFHSMLLNDELPSAIGRGIGRSRVYRFMLKKANIGEVRVNNWDYAQRELLASENINLL